MALRQLASSTLQDHELDMLNAGSSKAELNMPKQIVFRLIIAGNTTMQAITFTTTNLPWKQIRQQPFLTFLYLQIAGQLYCNILNKKDGWEHTGYKINVLTNKTLHFMILDSECEKHPLEGFPCSRTAEK
jgi:hypothetical protein